MVKSEWIAKGFADEPIENKKNLVEMILQLKRKKNAVILGHYYQRSEIQDIADFVGDSLAMAQWAAKVEADVLVVCGVHFMGETAKILCPDKMVLVPDLNAGCSLADSCSADRFAEFVAAYPDHQVISYVNTSAAVKSYTDVVVTSSNAQQIVESFPKDAKLIFGPDRNLGSYINAITGRRMILWDGACHVHSQFSVDALIALKRKYPDAAVLAHPECKEIILKLADVIGSTAALLSYAQRSDKNQFIVVTESGILHEMQKSCPDKEFIPAPPETTESNTSCICNECNYMRLNTLEKVYNCLLYDYPQIEVDADIAIKAIKPIEKMLQLSEKLVK